MHRWALLIDISSALLIILHITGYFPFPVPSSVNIPGYYDLVLHAKRVSAILIYIYVLL